MVSSHDEFLTNEGLMEIYYRVFGGRKQNKIVPGCVIHSKSW